MIIKAKQSTSWITPRKLRLVADTVRGKDLAETNLILSSLNKRGAQVINETIRQAVANAVNNLGLPEDTLVLKTLVINEGPKFRRFRAGARGQAKPYVLRTSHVVVELESPETSAKTKTKAESTAKPAAKAEPTTEKTTEKAEPTKEKAKPKAKTTAKTKNAKSSTAAKSASKKETEK